MSGGVTAGVWLVAVRVGVEQAAENGEDYGFACKENSMSCFSPRHNRSGQFYSTLQSDGLKN